jgi:hypothetical protein
MQGIYLSVYGEYGEGSVVCGTLNRLRIRGKNLCVHGEDAKRLLAHFGEYAKSHKSVYISVNNNTNLNFLKILFIYTIWNGLSQKPSHVTVPLRSA